MTEYERAKELMEHGRFSANSRWEEGVDHHPRAEHIFKFIREYNIKEQNNSLDLQWGGDGDAGEELLYALSVFFEYMEDYVEG